MGINNKTQWKNYPPNVKQKMFKNVWTMWALLLALLWPLSWNAQTSPNSQTPNASQEWKKSNSEAELDSINQGHLEDMKDTLLRYMTTFTQKDYRELFKKTWYDY